MKQCVWLSGLTHTHTQMSDFIVEPEYELKVVRDGEESESNRLLCVGVFCKSHDVCSEERWWTENIDWTTLPRLHHSQFIRNSSRLKSCERDNTVGTLLTWDSMNSQWTCSQLGCEPTTCPEHHLQTSTDLQQNQVYTCLPHINTNTHTECATRPNFSTDPPAFSWFYWAHLLTTGYQGEWMGPWQNIDTAVLFVMLCTNYQQSLKQHYVCSFSTLKTQNHFYDRLTWGE